MSENQGIEYLKWTTRKCSLSTHNIQYCFSQEDYFPFLVDTRAEYTLINRINCDTPLWLLVRMPGSRLDNQIPHLTDLSPGNSSPPQPLWRGAFTWTSVGARVKAPCFSHSFPLFFVLHLSFYLSFPSFPSSRSVATWFFFHNMQ